MSYFNHTLKVPKTSQDIWYVHKTLGDNANGGKLPEDAFETIGTAITAAVGGDIIRVGAGTYVETGITLSKSGLELWPEHGAILAPATGIPLAVSAHYCKIWCPGGSLFLTPPAGETGLSITGSRFYGSDVRINCASSANLGFDVNGAGAVLDNCRVAAPLVAAFKVQKDKAKLVNCGTGGKSGDSSIGYWITGSCDLAWLKDCSSRGHETSGYQVDTGCTNGVIKDCASGGGDGRWTDADGAFVWSGFTYDDRIHKTTTFAGAPTAYYICKLTGAVRASNIHGHVETVIPNTACDIHLELVSTNGTVDITLGPGVDIDSAVAGALLVRNGPSSSALDLADPNAAPAVAENTNWRDPTTAIDIVKDDSADTYLRVVLSAALASGAIHWHCDWEPLSDDGFLEPA